MRRLLQAAFALVCLLCFAPSALARSYDSDTKAQINTKVDRTLSAFYAKVPGSQEVVSRAAGVLVFPAAGFMFGGQHGGGGEVGFHGASISLCAEAARARRRDKKKDRG